MEKPEIRPAGVEDAEAGAWCHRQCWLEAYADLVDPVKLAELMQFMATAGISPHIDSMLPLADARKGFAKLNEGDVFGKIVFTV